MSTNFRFRIPFWRGFLVAACWLVWPFVFLVGEILVRLISSTSRGCSIEGCSYSASPIDILVILPPIIATALWWRWRRGRRAEQGMTGTDRDPAA
jgi:hypothetical protein